MLWHIELKACTWLCFNVLQIKFKCRHFTSIFMRPSSDGTYYGMVMSVRVSVRPSIRSPSGRSLSACFPHFFPTCFDILSWNFAHDFVLMYYRSSLSVITLRQFLKELCLFVNLEYGKYTVFRTFLLHALTYWAEIFHMTFFLCTSEQVRVSYFWVNFWRSYASFGTQNIGNTQISPVSSCMLWHIELKFCTWLCFNVLQIKFECHHFASIFEGVMPLCELRIWEIHSFPHFSPTCFDILSWNFAHDFVLMYYRASLSVVTLRQFLKELCFFVNLEYLFEILSWNFAQDFVLMYYRSSSSVVTLQPSVSVHHFSELAFNMHWQL